MANYPTHSFPLFLIDVALFEKQFMVKEIQDYLGNGGGEMKYYLDLFLAETYEALETSKRDISGFRKRQENVDESRRHLLGEIFFNDKY